MFNLFKKKEGNNAICAVTTGRLERIENCCDPVFSEKIIGDGLLIRPTSKEIVSPVDGEVVMMFPTCHAIGIKDNNNREYLIHIGVDTVALNGEGFKAYVVVNQKINKGQLLMEADFESMKDKVKATDVILIATDGRKCQIKKEKDVVCGEDNIAIFE